MKQNLDRIRVVLVRPEEAGNIGAAARALKNFGLSHLVLVSPRTARPEDARKWAHGAEDILDGADVVDDLADALAPCARAWATTRRGGRLRGRYLDVRDAARETIKAPADAPVAWVFGPESRGLRTDEVELCSARVTIPTAPEQPSLNLAQAVAVCCYETRRAAREEDPPAERRASTVAERDALYRHLETALLEIGFLHAHTARTRMAILRGLLERAQPTPREVKFLRGVARQMEWTVRDEE